ncbi:hypothetical protein Tco_0570817 [Tanacetum coccineum]
MVTRFKVGIVKVNHNYNFTCYHLLPYPQVPFLCLRDLMESSMVTNTKLSLTITQASSTSLLNVSSLYYYAEFAYEDLGFHSTIFRYIRHAYYIRLFLSQTKLLRDSEQDRCVIAILEDSLLTLRRAWT